MPTRKIHTRHALSANAVDIPTIANDGPTSVAQLPKTQLPAAAAYRTIHETLQLNHGSALNLSTFDHFWSEPESERLVRETLRAGHQVSIEKLQQSCLSIFSGMFHAPEAVGAACTTSPTEVAQLAGLEMLRNWRHERLTAGQSPNRPNLVLSAQALQDWEFFAQNFNVELRRIPCYVDRYHLDPQRAGNSTDVNTIGVVGVLGGAQTGNFDPICELHEAVTDRNRKLGWNIPLHIDAAQGGFVAAFLTPELVWDFQLPGVKSIHVSGRGYGTANPAVEWLLSRDASRDFPNPSSSAVAGMVAQYYNFLRLGHSGYSLFMRQLWDVSQFLAGELRATGRFEILSHEPCLPAVCFRSFDETRFSAIDISAGLLKRGWIVPAEIFGQDGQESTPVLRIVVQEGFGLESAKSFFKDLLSVMRSLDKSRRPRLWCSPHRLVLNGLQPAHAPA